MDKTINPWRKDFPLLQNDPVMYLDNAATAQRPACVIEAVKAFYEQANANPLRGFYPLSLKATQMYEDARKTVQRFIHAPSERCVIFTRNTTEGLNLVAYSYALHHVKAGDEIVVSIMEHHSNMLPWQMVASQTGATLRYMDCEPDGTLTDETIEQTIGKKTKLVAIGHVSNVLGCVNPVKKIIDRAHAVGAAAVLDAAQSAPHMPLDVQALDADFVAFSGHKLMGPMGIGVLYGREELLDKMPPFLTGGEMIESVTREGAVFAELPHKFEAGTVNAAGAVGLAAAIEYIQKIGFDAMQKQENLLVRRVMDGLKGVEHVRVLGSDEPENHTGIVSFVIDGVHPHDVSEILAADGIAVRAGHHCAQPLIMHLGLPATTRASFMFYNTPEEADALVASIADVRRKMGYGA